MAPPVSEEHAQPDNLLQTWLGFYAAHTPGVRALTNATLHLGPKDMPQPDAMLCLRPECGGGTRPWRKKYLGGIPELIVEVAASSVSIDLRGKLRSYSSAGVPEYLVWSTLEAKFYWFHREGGEYTSNPPKADGIIRSVQFPGLHLEVNALLEMDGRRVLTALQAGLASAEHAQFVARLRAP